MIKNRLTYYIPIILAVFYLTCTLILYVIGPLDWITYKPAYFWFLQITYIIMLVIGWQVGLKKTYISTYVWTDKDDKKIIHILSVALKINILYEFINIFRTFNMTSFNIIQMLKNILYGVANMGASYNSFQSSIGTIQGSQVVGGTIVTVFNYLWGIMSFTTVLLGGYYFKKLKVINKLIYILMCTIIVASYLATGTNIGIFRLILATIIFGTMKMIRRRYIFDVQKYRNRKYTLFFRAVILTTVMTILFDAIMKSRGGILLWNTSYYNIGGIGINKNSILFKIVPPQLDMLLVSASSYLTQGYYGMSLALQLEWLPTFGIGHSMFVMKLLSEHITDFFQLRTYQSRLSAWGWEEDVRWHSFYTWFANDIGFIGVTAVMFLVGCLFAMAYKDSIRTNNPFAYVMVYFFTLMIFFMPCNNQIFQSSYIMFSFCFSLIVWLCTRGKKKVKLR